MAAAADPDFIIELFSEFGRVAVRRMFGGAGIFADGVMIGLISNGVIFLKAGAANIPDFEREGCGPFVYSTKHGMRTIKSYWRMPERLYDDPQDLAVWAWAALAAARRGESDAQRKPKRDLMRASKRRARKPQKSKVGRKRRS